MKIYPEHEKLMKVKNESQSIGAFLDWLQNEKKISLCTYETTYDTEDNERIPEGYYNINESIQELLAKYFEIDLNKIEKEKQEMLEDLRKENKNYV